MPATSVTYKEYSSDKAKAARYERLLFIADERFKSEVESQGNDWYHRYENLPRRSQKTPKGRRVNVPAGVSTIDALFSSLTAVDVEALIRRIGGGTRAQAELVTAALAKEWEQTHVQTEASPAIKDSLVVGLGVVKVGYEYHAVVQEVPRRVEEVRADLLSLIHQAATAEADGLENVPTVEEIGDSVPLVNTETTVLRDRIVFDYVDWHDVRFDPRAKRWSDVTWVAHYRKMSAEDIKEHPTYRAYCRKQRTLGKLDELKGDKTFEFDVLPGGKATEQERYCTVVEFTDLETGTVCSFVKGKDWLLNEAVNPFALNFDMVDRNPFVGLVLRETNGRVRGISDMELIVPSLDELNAYRSSTATFTERFVPKTTGPEDLLTDEGKQALSNSEYGAYVATAAGVDGRVETLDPPVLPAEVWGMDQRISDEIREATGVNELMRGLFPDRKRTATETSEVVAASAARQAEKRNTMTEFWKAIARRYIQLMQMFYDQERMVHYVDPSYGEVQWVFTADDIAMEYAVDISLTPKEETTRQSRRDDATGFFNMMLPLATQPGPSGAPVIDAGKLVEWYAGEYGISKADQLEFIADQQEQAQAAQQSQQSAAAMAQATGGGGAGAPLDQGAAVQSINDASQAQAAGGGGALSPEMIAAAQGIGPGAPEAAQAVSESAGVRTPGIQ